MEADLGRDAAVPWAPLGGRLWQLGGKRVHVTSAERGAERTAQAAGLERKLRRDQDQVNEVLDAGAGAATGVAAGVGMDLLRDVRLQREGGDLRCFDLRRN
jgi:hypothetical protein